MKTLTKLNKYDFIITILESDTQNLPGPRYQVTCGLKSSEICTSSSVTITSLYQQIFNTKTKFSGPLVMGFDQQDIVNQMLENIQFRPFEFFIEKLRIIIIEIGTSKNCEWNYAGVGYQSSFTYKIEKENFLFVKHFTDTKLDNKPKYNANTLFGLENIYTQELIRQLKYEFWTRSLDSEKDQETLKNLYNLSFFQPVPNYNQAKIFWGSRRYARFYGLGGECLEKPIYERNRISQERLDQLQQFLNDKNNIIMSSYKTDTKTGLLVKYIKDTKEALWEKF
ncbi:11668_t:CDS:2, partial [Diversispora eburnea]